MTRTYYTVIVLLEKDKGHTTEPEIAIKEVKDTHLPPLSITIDSRHIAIHTFHQVYENAQRAANDTRRRWKAGTFHDVLNALITEIAGYKTAEDHAEVTP
jgi:hypothetical protein